MIKINKKVEYSLIALKFMAQKPKNALTSAREICDHFDTPFDTTAKVLQLMNQHNILDSVKGIRGGYTIKKPLESISYIELVQLIEGKKPEGFCHSSKGCCDLYQKCNIIDPIEQLNTKINQFLEGLTLKELLMTRSELLNLNTLEN